MVHGKGAIVGLPSGRVQLARCLGPWQVGALGAGQ